MVCVLFGLWLLWAVLLGGFVVLDLRVLGLHARGFWILSWWFFGFGWFG